MTIMTQEGFWEQLFRSTSNLKVRVVAWRHLQRKTPTAVTVSA